MSVTIFEGIDRSGKDYLAKKLFDDMKKDCDVTFYQDDVKKPDFKLDPMNYKFYLIDVNNRKLKMANRESNLIIVRFYISELVFSKLFNREPLIGSIESFESRLTAKNIVNVHVKIDYATYIDRCEKTDEKHVYSEKEFNDITSLYDSILSKSKFNIKTIRNN